MVDQVSRHNSQIEPLPEFRARHLARQDVYQLDAAAVAAQEVVDKIADDEVRAARAAVDDAAGEDGRGAVPLDVHGTAAMAFEAAYLGPAGRAARFLFLDDLERVSAEPGIVGDGIA